MPHNALEVPGSGRGEQPVVKVSVEAPQPSPPLTYHQQEQDPEVGGTPHCIFRTGLGAGSLVSGLEVAGSRAF